jgi:hypothetical protein
MRQRFLSRALIVGSLAAATAVFPFTGFAGGSPAPEQRADTGFPIPPNVQRADTGFPIPPNAQRADTGFPIPPNAQRADTTRVTRIPVAG